MSVFESLSYRSKPSGLKLAPGNGLFLTAGFYGIKILVTVGMKLLSYLLYRERAPMRSCRQIVFALLFSMYSAHLLLGQNLLVNGDFEADTFTVWPGYIGNGNPEQISGWMGAGGNGVNPVFAAQNPDTVTGWTRNEDSTGNIGINPVTDGRAPFGDNGDNDGGFLFMQGAVSAYQEVTGLTVGSDYVLSIDYNARNCCEDIPAVSLEIGGELSDAFPDPEDFFDEAVDPVLEGAWWFTEIPFEATAESMRIEFFSEPFDGGDATFLLDNIEVTSAAGGANLIENGDFEADLEVFAVWPGYLGGGAGQDPAPFRDNGDNETQIGFLQGGASIEQTIEGLVPGTEYTLSLDFNARVCCGDVQAPMLLIDEEPLIDFPFEDDEIVESVGESNEWYSYSTTYTADFESAVLKIQGMSANGGDSTLIVDNVFFGIPVEEPEFAVGDCDLDGLLSADDLDCVGDIAERDAVLAALNTLPGDLDGDGDVAFDDFLELATNFGKDPATYSEGNVDLVGGVAFLDFLELATNFGQVAAAAEAVPEPNGVVILTVGVVMLLGARRRA